MVIECSLIAGSEARGCLVLRIGKNQPERVVIDINRELAIEGCYS